MLASKALGKAFLVSNLVLIRLVIAVGKGDICPRLGLPQPLQVNSLVRIHMIAVVVVIPSALDISIRQLLRLQSVAASCCWAVAAEGGHDSGELLALLFGETSGI